MRSSAWRNYCAFLMFVAVVVIVLVVVLSNGKSKSSPAPRQRDQIHLLVQWYFAAFAPRHAEYLRAIRNNLANEHITLIHFLQGREDRFDVNFEYKVRDAVCNDPANNVEVTLKACENVAKKIRFQYLEREGRLSAQSAFQFASDQLKGVTCMFSNLDIYFDDTLRFLKLDSIDLDPFHSYYLSRYEEDDSEGHTKTQCGDGFIGSHDTIVFVPPLPAPLLERSDFTIGSWGIENRLMWEFEQFGIVCRNPCIDIHSWHAHESNHKSSWMPQVNDEYSSVAHPTSLFPTRFRTYRRDHRFIWTQETLSIGSVLLIRGLSSTMCLFSRLDGKFGHAVCDESSPHMHFVWAPLAMDPMTVREMTLLPENATNNLARLPAKPYSQPSHFREHRLVTRQTGWCLTIIGGSLLTHRPCGLNELVGGSCPPLETFGQYNAENTSYTGCAALPEVQTWTLDIDPAIHASKISGKDHDGRTWCLENVLGDILRIARQDVCKENFVTLYWNIHLLHPV